MRSLKFAAVLCAVALFVAGAALPTNVQPLRAEHQLEGQGSGGGGSGQGEEMKVNMCIAVVDTGQLGYFERFDVVQWGSIDVAVHKAKASVQYKRATLALENAVKSNVHYLTLDGISAIEGGVPIVEGGRIVGAIGASGGSSVQDGQVAQAGAAVIK